MSRKMRRQSEHERLGGLDTADDDASDDEYAWMMTRKRETSQAMKSATRDMRGAGAMAVAADSEAVKSENSHSTRELVGTIVLATNAVRMTIRG